MQHIFLRGGVDVKKNLFLVIGCLLICTAAYRFGGTEMEGAKRVTMERIYLQISKIMLPQLHMYDTAKEEVLYRDMEQILMPVVSDFREEIKNTSHGTSGEQSGQDESSDTVTNSENTAGTEISTEVENEENVNVQTMGSEAQVIETNASLVMEKKVEINRTKLQDFDYLRLNFYQVDNTTTVGSDLLNVNEFLEKDMTLTSNVEGPQILIYHTHSQEAYADSIPGDASMSVVALGDYLTTILEEKYGIEVLHHKGEYDVEGRNNAYARALPELKQILQENPSIEVVIDLHRDGVPETLHLVSEVNGKQTAQIMFFNGLSRTTSQGELTYLVNPYIEENLAFSFQLQLAAAEYYPGFARQIYLKGYRYNLHLRPKSLLVEVGAQTNTFEEAKNAMEPLASILAMVLLENSSQ